jgi:hypothetical protein
MVQKTRQLVFESSNGYLLASSTVEANVEGKGDACDVATYAQR